MRYQKPDVEVEIIKKQSNICQTNASKLIIFGTEIRKAFEAGELNSTISTRELVNSARIAYATGDNFKYGIKLGYLNRLSRVDFETVDQLAQRIFGN